MAELDESGRVPSSQLPSYVDDVVEYPSRSDFPTTGESGKIYVATDTNLAYRWGGTEYVEISPSLALGTTAETAGRGDWTQAAYNHSLIKDGSNPHKTTFASLPDKPTSLPANGGNADTVDNLHASSFAQIKSYNFPSGGINNITDLDFTGNIQAHFPGAEYSCIWQGKDFAGTILQLKLRDYAGKQSMMYRGSLTKTWRTVWDSSNFNPDDKFGFSADQLSDLNNAPNNAFFVGAHNAANAPVADSWSNGFTISYGNNPDFRKQFVYAGDKWWTRGRDGVNWGTWRQIWDSGNFNPDSKFNNLGQANDSNNVVGNGYTLKELGATFSGPFLKWGLPGHMFEFFSANRINEIQIRHMSQGVWGDPVIIYHSGNFNPNNYLPLSGNKTITGNVALANEVMITNQNGGNLVGFRNSLSEFGDAGHATRIVSNDSDLQHWRGGQNTIIYDSSNLGNATTSKAGLMSAADKIKLDGLSGGGLNIPASGEVAISGWTYNGKQVYAQRWTGEFTGVTKNLTTIEGLSAILMKGGTLFLYESRSNSVGLGSSQWNQTTGDITRISDLQYNLSTGSVTVAAWYGGTSSPTTVNWSYEVWAAYTK